VHIFYVCIDSSIDYWYIERTNVLASGFLPILGLNPTPHFIRSNILHSALFSGENFFRRFAIDYNVLELDALSTPSYGFHRWMTG